LTAELFLAVVVADTDEEEDEEGGENGVCISFVVLAAAEAC